MAKGEAVGKISHQLTQTIFPVPLEEINAELHRTGRWEGELVHTKRDGTRVVVASRWSMQRDEQGNPLATLETNNDITERKRAEEALRESEEQWKAAFENNPTMYFMIDETGTVLSVNPFGAEQLGYEVDELVGRSVWDIFHKADRDAVQGNVAICLEQLGQSVRWEVRKIRKDGAVLWVRETARATSMKRHPVVLIACEDITERKRAEVLTRQMFESSPDGIAVVGRDYRYHRVNPVYERNWRMPAERIVGMHVADLLGTEVFEQTIKPELDRCFAGEEIRYTSWLVNARGRSYIAVSYSPLRPDSKAVEAALVISHDLTEHELAAEALREAQMNLAHVNRVTTMGQLTASIAHEVNQPIAAAVINAQAALRWLGAHPPDLEEARQHLDWIVRDSNRAGEVISRILTLVRKAPPQIGRVDINDTIFEVVALMRHEAERHRVELTTRLARDLPTVLGDRVQLQQVILNLLTNAIDVLKGLDEGPRELLVGSERDDVNGLLVTVRDSGPGLDWDRVDDLFEAFYTTKPAGIGMGLAISRSIVEAHGGQLWATPNAPRGAVFQFTLPLEAEEASSSQHTRSFS